jgi:GTP pyrophosphokinase
VAGRPKHIYSIWRKMQKKNVPIGELYDLRAVRVLVDDVPMCYAVLGVVHALWLPVPEEFDDYIARPKRNDYRSLHTAVIGPEGKTLEVQIRTHEMHAQAELGVAAHWKYKEGRGHSKGADAAMEKRIAWMRQLLESEEEANLLRETRQRARRGPHLRAHAARRSDRLAAGRDAARFRLPLAHRSRASLPRREDRRSHRAARPRAAQRRSRRDPDRQGRRTAARLAGASNGFLASARSREKVRSWFHKLDRARNLQAGREMLDRELKRLGLAKADLAPVFARFNVARDDDLVVLVALGDVGPHQVGRALLEHERAQAEPEPIVSPVVSRAPSRSNARTSPSRASATCSRNRALLPAAAGRTHRRLPHARQGRVGASRRLRDLHAPGRAQPQRAIPVEWGGARRARCRRQLLALDRKWLLKDVTNLIAQENAHVSGIHSDPERGTGRVRLGLRLRVDDYGQLSSLLGKLAAVPGVEDARRAT